MLSAEQSSYTVQAAGQALASSAFEARKRAKKHARSQVNQSRVNNDTQTRKLAQSLTETADVCLDRFIERVERILRRDGANEFLKKLDQVMPEREPLVEDGDTRALVRKL